MGARPPLAQAKIGRYSDKMNKRVKFRTYGKYQRKMYLMNLMLAFSLMLVLVTIIFGLVFQISAKDYQVVMDESIEKTLANVALKGEIFAEALQTIEQSQNMTQLLLAQTRGEHYLYAYRLKAELAKISARYLNANFILSFALADQETSVINPYGTMSKPEFSKDFFGRGQGLEATIKDLTSQDNDRDQTFIHQDQIHYIRYRRQGDRAYLIFLQVPIAEMIDCDPQINWYLGDQKGIVARSGPLSQADLAQLIDQKREVLEYNHERGYAHYIKGLDWVVVASYQKKRLNLTSVFFYYFLPFISLSGLVAWVSALITGNLYRPIKELVLETKGLVAGESGEDEMQLLKQGTQQAHQLYRDLQVVRLEKEKLMQMKGNRDLLFGIIPRFGGDLQENTLFCVAVFALYSIQTEERRYLLKQFLQDHLQAYQEAAYINTEDVSCAVILKIGSLKEAKQFISRALDQGPEEDVQVALSDPVFGLVGIKTAYLQCNLLLEYKYLYRQQRFLTADLIKVRLDQNYSYPLDLEHNLIQMVLRGDTDSLKVFDQIIDQNQKLVDMAPQIRQRFVLMLIASLYRILRELYMDIPMPYPLTQLERLWQDEEIFIKIRQNLQEILNFVRSKEKGADDSLAQVMLAYIDDHYQEDIMLVDLAAKINSSEKYCSSLFKQAVGQNFKTYLNGKRIDKAKDLLGQNPNLKIGDLAGRVGFNSANTFIRVFSKQMGITPKVYADMVRSGDFMDR